MRNRFILTCGALVTAASMAAAQPPPVTQPPPSQPSRPQPQDPTRAPARTPDAQKPEAKLPIPGGRLTRSELKLTGCLQRAEAPSRDTSGDKPAGLAAGYTLIHATATPAEGDEPSAARGTKEYRLLPKNDSIDLGQHVGHQIEVVGNIDVGAVTPDRASTDTATSTSRPSGSTGVQTTPQTGQTPAPLVTVTVSSLKMIAASCTTPAP